jgi:hypothetical protein
MHSVRLVSFALGLWLAGGLFMAWVATQNFRGVDRLLDEPNPTAQLEIKALDNSKEFGPGAARMLLRYHASEQNRYYFESWELVQIVLGSMLFFFLLFATRDDKFSLSGVLLLLIVVAVQRAWLTPEIVKVGRSLDFVMPGLNAPDRAHFWQLHSLYSGAEVLKWVVLLTMTVRLVASRSRDVGKQFDVVDKADHRHVDR